MNTQVPGDSNEPTPAPDDRSSDSLARGGLGRWLRRWLFRLLMVVLALLLVIILVLAGLVAALRSDTGTAWVLDQIPGLETDQARGSLLGEWQAEGIRWRGFGVTLDIDRPYVDWSPTCLIERTLCLEVLRADAIDLAILPDDQPSEDTGSPLALPTLRLPLTLEIREVDLGPLDVNGDRIWDRLALRAAGSGTDWYLESLSVEREDLTALVSGRFETRGDWPLALDIDLDLRLPPPLDQPWQVTGTVGGSVRDLRLGLVSRGYLEAQLEARLGALNPALPAQVTLQSGRFLPLDTLPPTLALTDWRLDLSGNLSRGYELGTTATLPGDPLPVALQLQGLLTSGGLTGLQLLLTSDTDDGSGDRGRLQVDGDLLWQGGLSAEVDLELDRFPWYTLLPELEAPPVRVEQLTASARYEDDRYEASLSMTVDGPQGGAELQTALNGDMERVTLSNLRVTTGAGRLRGDADVGFSGPITWQARLALEDFNPGYWVPEAEALVSGGLESEGTLTESNDGEWLPDVLLTWSLNGEWQSAPLSTEGRLVGDQVNGHQRWDLEELVATLGQNRVSALGYYDGEFELNLSLLAPDLEVVVPGLGGVIEATLEASGDPLAPVGQLAAQARDLAWQDQLQVAEIDLDMALQPGLALSSSLRVTDLLAAGQRVASVTADLEGDLEQHQLTLSASHAEADLALVLTGSWQDVLEGLSASVGPGWSGQLAEGDIRISGPGQRWVLDQEAPIRFVPGELLTLGSHCWRWQDSALCSGDQTLLPDMTVSLTLDSFPTTALAPLMPETLRWDAWINGELDVTMEEEGPRGAIRLSAGPGDVAVVLEDDWESLDYDVLDLSLELTPDEARAGLRLQGDGLGELVLALSLDPTDESLPARGDFSLQGFDMALIGGFLDMEEVTGGINGEGRLEGPLLNPEVYGELRLDDGRVVDPGIPLPLEQLAVVLSFDGRRATLDGRWSSNGSSEGEVTGELNWQDQPVLTLNLAGDRLPVTYDPYARLEVSPELTVIFSDGDLNVSGRVVIPRGDITVRQLPETAVSVSDDEVIVGVEAEAPVVRSFTMDVQVLVGEESVTFSGFGVTGKLEGALRVANDMDTRGTLQMVDGRYQAFGQELELRRARLVFVGPLAEPYLEIEAIRQVDQVVAGIRLTGPVAEPQTEIFSEPPMSQNEALSYVILGRPLQSQGDDGQMQRAALSLGLAQTSRVTRGIGEELGIRDLTLEAEGSGDEAAVVASGYLTDQLSIRYGVGLFEPITTVALRYDIGSYFYVEAASGLASSIDIFYTRSF